MCRDKRSQNQGRGPPSWRPGAGRQQLALRCTNPGSANVSLWSTDAHIQIKSGFLQKEQNKTHLVKERGVFTPEAQFGEGLTHELINHSK